MVAVKNNVIEFMQQGQERCSIESVRQQGQGSNSTIVVNAQQQDGNRSNSGERITSEVQDAHASAHPLEVPLAHPSDSSSYDASALEQILGCCGEVHGGDDILHWYTTQLSPGMVRYCFFSEVKIN
jgi:hypothetical protein